MFKVIVMWKIISCRFEVQKDKNIEIDFIIMDIFYDFIENKIYNIIEHSM